MVPEEKLRELVAKLLVKGEKGEVNWGQEAAGPQGPGATKRIIYSVRFPASTAMLQLVSPPNEDDFHWFLLLNSDGKVVGRLRAVEGDPDWVSLRALYDQADRAVTHWDRALADAEDALDTPGPIGTPEF